MYGPTSAYRLAPERKVNGHMPSDGQNQASPESIVTNQSPMFDWSRHLPSDAPLSRSEHDRYVHPFSSNFIGLLVYTGSSISSSASALHGVSV